MKAASLLAVFVLAKILVLSGRDIPVSAATPLVYLWQDLLAVLLFAGLDFLVRKRPGIGWSAYGLLVCYVAVNVPIACLLSTWLTWPLLSAARLTLADSILHHVTWSNGLRVGAILSLGIVLPVLLRRIRKRLPARIRCTAMVVLFLLIALGLTASARVETFGLHRNALIAIVATALPRVSAEAIAGDWGRSPFGGKSGDDLSRIRGAAAGRNVVIIHLESTGAGYLRPYGAVEDPMPNLTALARQAIVFENAYTVYPETIKSFYAVQCSIYPALDTKSKIYEQVRSPALAQVLGNAGYRTGLFHSGRFMYLGMDSVIRNRGYDTLEDAGDIGGERESSFGIDEHSTVRRILSWIDVLPKDQRFLVSYLPIAGHHPYETPTGGPFPDDGEMNRYLNALHYSDASVGELLDGLKRRGLDRNTLFVIFGDHGEAFHQHCGNFGHTLFIYEENVRVPYLIVVPGVIREPLRLSRVASLLDTAPTVLDLLGVSVPGDYQGRSLLDGECGMALFCTDYSLGFLGLRDGRWKLIHELDSNRSQLFDLLDDPRETTDLSKQFPERIEVYRKHLLRWAASQKYLIAGR